MREPIPPTRTYIAPGPNPRRTQRLRRAGFAVAAVLLGLLAVEGAGRLLEGLGLGGVTLDDRANYVLGPVFERRGEAFVTSEYAERWMIPARLDDSAERRVFVVGGSFAMGTPYEYQGYGREVGGGPVSWTRAFLEDPDLELVNASAGGQSSFRVRRIVERLLPLEPKGVVVASCNNEGVPPPSRLLEAAHGSAAYRVLRGALRPEVAPEDRPEHTEQQRTRDEIARDFRRNLNGIARSTAGAGVPVLLALPPSNLRMERERELETGVSAACVDAVREDLPIAEVVQACGGASQGALMALGEERLEDGDVGASRRAFEAAVEFGADQRCPASLQQVIRDVAERWDHVTLVDLRAAAEQTSESGVPGDDLFVDSCHMNWRGYRAVGGALAAALVEVGWADGELATEPGRPVVPPGGEVFVAHRRWPPNGVPGPEALARGIRVGEPGASVDTMIDLDDPFGWGAVGSWALVPLLLEHEARTRPDELARYLVRGAGDDLEVVGFVGADDVVRPGPGEAVRVELHPRAVADDDRPVAIPLDRIGGTWVDVPLGPDGPVALRIH